MSKLRQSYFRWLFAFVNNKTGSYLKISEYLDKVRFHWDLPNDGNREADAIREREIFVAQNTIIFPFDQTEEFYLEPVSVFEVMVALCKRIDYNLDVLGEPAQFSRWYEELLSNLELDYFTNYAIEDTRYVERDIDRILDKLLNRKYDRAGNGSFFPLKNPGGKNMKKTEIWYQMMAYIDENYQGNV